MNGWPVDWSDRSADDKAADDRAADDRAADDGSADDRAADDRSADDRSDGNPDTFSNEREENAAVVIFRHDLKEQKRIYWQFLHISMIHSCLVSSWNHLSELILTQHLHCFNASSFNSDELELTIMKLI